MSTRGLIHTVFFDFANHPASLVKLFYANCAIRTETVNQITKSYVPKVFIGVHGTTRTSGLRGAAGNGGCGVSLTVKVCRHFFAMENWEWKRRRKVTAFEGWNVEQGILNAEGKLAGPTLILLPFAIPFSIPYSQFSIA